MINLIAWIVFGLVAGAIAKFLKPGPDNEGWVTTIIIGIVGSVLGGFLGRIFFGAGVTNNVFNFYSLVMAVVGSILVLYAYKAMSRK